MGFCYGISAVSRLRGPIVILSYCPVVIVSYSVLGFGLLNYDERGTEKDLVGKEKA